jgi:hypothetical protein
MEFIMHIYIFSQYNMLDLFILRKVDRMKRSLIIIFIILLVLLLSSGCGGNKQANVELESTLMALSVQGTLDAQHVQEVSLATQMLLSAQGTSIAVQQTQLAALKMQTQPPVPKQDQVLQPITPITIVPPSTNTPTPVPQTPTPSISFEDWKKTATILLYEDIVGMPGIVRYVSKALNNLGLKYKDDGSSKGNLRDDLMAGGTGGKPWDLILISSEKRGDPTGQYFALINQALDKGSFVVLEIWYLDIGSSDDARALLGQCGLSYQGNYIGKPSQPLDLVIYPINGLEHPILSQPNSGIRFSNIHAQWPSSRDFGDWMQLTGNGDGQLLLGTSPRDNTGHGVLSACRKGQFILQTFSSHNLAMESAIPLWENYIHNALQLRYKAANK